MTEETPSHLIRLNPEQYDAVTHTQGPLLILAGAGSGKTRVLTRRIAHLLHIGVDPENLFAVTFTNKAAAEMKERVTELVGPVGRKVWVSTFHSSCCRILRKEAKALGYTPRFAIYDDDDQLRMLKQIFVDLGYDPKDKEFSPRQVMGRIDFFKNRMIRVDDAVQQRRAHINDRLVRIWRVYEDALTASDAMDFNDLIGMAVRLFTEHPDILEKYREQFKYVMVDEYQDTNRSQYTLLQMLTSEHRNLAVVGDDDQSIYGFRGADISNILNFEKDFPDAKVVRMEQNYRCTENILALANAVVEKNEGRIEKKLWTEQSGGPKVQFLLSEDPRSEARAISTACLELRRRGTQYQDIAVIYRTNATSQVFESAFRERRIPYKVVGGRQFYARREIRDALAYVRLVVNPADDAAFLRICNVPTRGVGTKTVTRVRKEASDRGEPLLKTARSVGRGSDRAGKALGGFVQLVDGLVDISQTASLPAFLAELLERTGYAQMLREEDSKDGKTRLEHLNQLLRDAAAFEPDEDADVSPLHGWLDRISLTGSDEEIPEGGEVTLMTVHNSKGLEYPVVFVVNMVEGQFPHRRSAEEPGGVDEERRLAYVAFTRAQKRLVVSRSRRELTWNSSGQREQGGVVAASRFLFDIPTEVCDGKLPDHDPEEEKTSGMSRPHPGQRLSRSHQDRLRAVIARYQTRDEKPEPEPRMPEGDYVTVDIESPEQLQRGTRVLHDRFGVGEVVRRRAATLFVRFEAGVKPVGLADGRLQLLRD